MELSFFAFFSKNASQLHNSYDQIVEAMIKINQSVISESEIIRPTHLEINLDALARNYAAIQQHVGGRKMMLVLKANAYGHGLVPIGKLAERLGADYFGVGRHFG